MTVSKSETESHDQEEGCVTAYLDSLLNAGLPDSESDTDSDSTEIPSKEPQSALELKSESAALKLKVDSLLGSLFGESIALKDEDRDSVKSESAVGTSKEPHEKEDALTVEGDPDCEILSSDEDAPGHKAPETPAEVSPAWQPEEKALCSWVPRPSDPPPRPTLPPARLPGSRLPQPSHVHSDVRKTVEEVVEAKDFHPEDFFFLANTLVEERLGRSLRNDDIEICDSPGQKELLVKELEIKLTIPIEALAPDDTAKQLLSAMLALRLQMGTSAVPTAKEPESMPMSKSKLKKLKSQRPSRSAAEGQAEVNALQQDILQILKGMGRLPLGGLGNQFGSRFSSLRKEGHIEIRKFRQWLESMPGVSIHGKVVDYSKSSSSRARTETGEGTAPETFPKRDPQWRKLIEQSRKVPRRF
eukprot:symbB.v1.2.002417.t1/scaffold129.1/size311234/6